MGNKNKVNYHFGAKGWQIIGFETVLLFFMTGMTVDGLNIIVPAVAAYRGWDPNVLLSLSTPAGIIALILSAFWGFFIEKFGLKRTTVTTVFLAAIVMIAYGNAVSIPMYAVCLILMVTFTSAFGINCGFAICANWFPTQKGIVLGITTIGMNLASALINIILNGLTQAFNIAAAISIIAIALAVVGVLMILFVQDTPEKAGCLPDNSPEVAAMIGAEELRVKDEKKTSYAQALKNPQVWVLGIAYGCFAMATMGIMSQLVSYFMEVREFDINKALMTVTISAVIGMVGSWLWGIIDQTIGTKKASIIFGVWYCIGILLLLMPNTAAMYLGIFMLGFAVGGNGNFAPSMASYVFGRRDFAVNYSCMNMIVGVVRFCAFVVLASLRTAFAGYTIPYVVFAVISLIGAVMIALTKVSDAYGRE